MCAEDRGDLCLTTSVSRQCRLKMPSDAVFNINDNKTKRGNPPNLHIMRYVVIIFFVYETEGHHSASVQLESIGPYCPLVVDIRNNFLSTE